MNDSMTDEISAQINCHRVTTRSLKSKYKSLSAILERKDQKYWSSKLYQNAYAFGNLPCRELKKEENMAHVEKYKSADITGLAIHYERREGCELSNQNIDITRSHLNYNLAQELQPLHPEAFIKNRLKEVKHINRKDINVMVDWIVTLPKNVPQEDEQKLFEHTYQFMKKEYGEKNIISAWVHKDETTPHIHIGFIPVIMQDGIERLNCKKIINKPYLKTFHPKLEKYLEKALGYVPEILNDATINGNRTVKELKNQEDLSLKKSLKNVHEHLEASQSIISNADKINFETSSFLEKTKSLKKCHQIIDELKYSNKQLQADTLSLTNLVNVQKKEIDSYRQMPLAKQLKQRDEVIHNLYSSIDLLEDQIRDYEYDNQTLRDNNHYLDNKVDNLKNELSIFKTFISWLGLDKIFQKFKNMFIYNNYEMDIHSFKEISLMALQKISKKIENITNRISFLEKQNLPTNEIMTQQNDSQTIKNIIR